MKHGHWGPYPTCEISCDVVVVGGGLAGLMAARAAAAAGASVTVVCKGYAGADGASAFAGGVVLYMQPEDDWDGFLTEHLRHAEGLADPERVRAVAELNSPLWAELGRLGAPLERDGAGHLRRRWLRIGSRTTVPRLALESVAFMRFLRRLTRRQKVRFLDQTAVTGLLTAGGAVRGVAGFRRQSGHLVAITAPAVVLAAGGCSWRGAHMGQHNLQGDGYGLALAAGADLMSMEFCTSYLATCGLFDTHGQCVLHGMGGRFLNAAGEDIIARHGFPNPAPTHLIARAMLTELREGRGPVRFDLRGISAQDRRDWEARFALVAEGLRRTGTDVFETPVPWIPGFTGSIAGSGGVRTHSLYGDTGVPGLFAAGDTAARTPLVGAGSGITFLNLAWAAVSGHLSGAAAAGAAQEQSGGRLPAEAVQAAWQQAAGPLERPDGTAVVPLLRRLQAVVVDPEVNYFRTGAGLQEAIAEVRRVWDAVQEVKAADWHDLARCHELRHATLTAYAMLASAAARTETRGWHCRADYPQPDDERWRRWTVFRGGACNGELAGAVETVAPADATDLVGRVGGLP